LSTIESVTADQLQRPITVPTEKISVLSFLVAPNSVERFLRDFWPDRVFQSHGPLSRLPALFASPELSSFRALASRYRGRLGFGRGAKSSRMLSMQEANPAHLYEMGMSVYLPDLALNLPGTDGFLRALEAELGLEESSCHVTVWASPREDGASTHFDGEDVISVQLSGTKQFDVAPMREYAYPYGPQFGPGGAAYDEMYPQLECGFPDPSQADFQTISMTPGSVLFVPRGTWHRTRAEQDSFAISIGIRPPCAVDAFLDQLKYLLLQDPEWRRPLYGVQGSARQRKESLERVHKALQRAQAAIGGIAPDDLARPPMAEILGNIMRTTRFQRDLGAYMTFELVQGVQILNVITWTREGGEQNTLKMRVPPPYLPTLRWLAETRTAFSAGDLADRLLDVPFEQHQKILNALTRAGYFRLLWFPPLPAA